MDNFHIHKNSVCVWDGRGVIGVIAFTELDLWIVFVLLVLFGAF